VAQNKTVKVAQNETQSVTPPPPKLAQFEPKSLALTDRNHWHNSNRNSHPLRDPSRQGTFNEIIEYPPSIKGFTQKRAQHPALRIAREAIPHGQPPCFAAKII
jgi:hypothetical protein